MRKSRTIATIPTSEFISAMQHATLQTGLNFKELITQAGYESVLLTENTVSKRIKMAVLGVIYLEQCKLILTSIEATQVQQRKSTNAVYNKNRPRTVR